ncbi:structural maintenance of chromosomes protein 6, partial [Kipferlia bialata]|eukprot:g9732.t1
MERNRERNRGEDLNAILADMHDSESESESEEESGSASESESEPYVEGDVDMHAHDGSDFEEPGEVVYDRVLTAEEPSHRASKRRPDFNGTASSLGLETQQDETYMSDGSDYEDGVPRRQRTASQERRLANEIPEEYPGMKERFEGGMDELGNILSVRMHNFLIHPNLTVNFTKQVTLIHGQNGSGKSSILEAVKFALGCTAREIRPQCNNHQALLRRLKGDEVADHAEVEVEIGYPNGLKKLGIIGNTVFVRRTLK